MPLIVATYVCMQPVYNAGRAAHALHSTNKKFSLSGLKMFNSTLFQAMPFIHQNLSLFKSCKGSDLFCSKNILNKMSNFKTVCSVNPIMIITSLVQRFMIHFNFKTKAVFKLVMTSSSKSKPQPHSTQQNQCLTR